MSLTIRAVLFDLDNTLYDRDRTFEQCVPGFVEEHFAALETAERLEVLRQMLTRGIIGVRARAVLFTEILERYPALSYDPEALCTQFFQHWLKHMSLSPNTASLLDALDEKGIPFGIITNGSVRQNLKIERLGLHRRARCIFISEVFGVRKPAAPIFEAAAAALDIACEQILFVGDNPEADICGAKSTGMMTAWLHCDNAWPDSLSHIQPDFQIASLDNLLILLSLP